MRDIQHSFPREHLLEAIRIGLQCGIVDYILKPFQFKRFEKSIEAFVQRQELLNSRKPITQKQLDQFRSLDKQP